MFALRKAFGPRFAVAKSARIASPGRINVIGPTSQLSIAANVQIEEDSWINVIGTCSIGEGTYISVRALIGCEDSVAIGNRVAIGPNVTIIDTNKNYANLARPILEQGGTSKPIQIGDDCWLGANVVVLPGATLGKHTVVGAGSIVTGSFPPNVLIAGVPARVVRQLDQGE